MKFATNFSYEIDINPFCLSFVQRKKRGEKISVSCYANEDIMFGL